MKAINKLYEVLRAMNRERDPQIGLLYHMMDHIIKADLKHAQKYIGIIKQ